MTSGNRPEPVERTLRVARTARYFTWGHGPHAWFVLHGYMQLARRFLRRFEGLDPARHTVIAPEGLSRFYLGNEPGRHGPTSRVGATWMTRECREDEIRDYVAYLDQLADTVRAEWRGGGPDSTTVLGFSQGAATATRWVSVGKIRPDRLILWGDTLPPDTDLAQAADRLARLDLVLVRGDADPAVPVDRAVAAATRLEGAGLPHRSVVYSGGHDIEPATLSDLARIQARVERD